MALLTHDLSALPPDVRERVVKNLQHEDQARWALARIEQAKMAKLYNENVGPGTTKDGLGPLNMVLTQYFRNQLMHQHGQRCMADPDFRKWLRKNYEAVRVRETGTRVQSGWRPVPIKHVLNGSALSRDAATRHG